MVVKKRYKDFISSPNFAFYIKTIELIHPVYELHTHEFFSELVVILGGTGINIVDNEEFPIAAGDVFVLNGDVVHGFKDINNLKLCNIIYHPERLLDQAKDVNQLAGYHSLFILEPHYRQKGQFTGKLHLEIDELIHVARLITLMETEYNQKRPGYETIISAYFDQLTVYLARQYNWEGGVKMETTWQLAEVIAYIERHYTEPLRLEELAASVCVSPTHFLRIFRQAFNTSPIDYVIRLRVYKACELLRNHSMTISQVAFEVGFPDSNYFSRQFRRIVGRTPSEYRRELQNSTIPAMHLPRLETLVPFKSLN